MNIKSAAVVNFAPQKGSVEIREFAKPEIGNDDVLLEVVRTWLAPLPLNEAGDQIVDVLLE